MVLMNATIDEALGLNGNTDEIDLLQRRIDALNNKMITLVTHSVNTGSDIEVHESDFKEIADEITQLKNKINAIQDRITDDQSTKERLERIQQTMNERTKQQNDYDETIVRQMIECIKVYHDKRIEIIFGGGYVIEEKVE